ncbi:TlpA disulfide reductase family protein [Dysgonomonas sp. 520]|uniref:TlpA disulfide reductase family protein n=1 Tax=Dysgonomonas sp. 520 TaxID=2302931 RepID=UPI0013D3FFE8|nr:TlpA disulfide reductase family protein [Dysgonomonas sp. 520]
MKKIESIKYVILSLVAVVLLSCKSDPKFTIKGEIKGVRDTMLYLEHRGLTKITIVDSVKVKSDGAFEIKGAAPQFPELYALRLGNQYINLGVDSTETITVRTTKDNFATGYEIEGSENNLKIKDISLLNYEVTKDVNRLKEQYQEKLITEQQLYDSASVVVDNMTKIATDIIAKNPGSIAAYFAIFQKINGDLLFDPYDRKQSKLYGAVATQWDTHYKDSPRSKHLREFALSALRTVRDTNARSKLLDNVAEMNTSDYLKISLPDVENKNVDLQTFIGTPVILDFTTYLAEYSPLHNVELNKIYEKYNGRVVIYQVSFDPDFHNWKNSAVNLPWISVRDKDAAGSKLFGLFNISELPTTYIINKQGEIVKRMTANDNLETEIVKVL